MRNFQGSCKLKVWHYFVHLIVIFKKIVFLFLFILILTSCSRMPTPDFQHLTLSNTPNYYLMCPKGFCNIPSNAYSPVFPISADDLFNEFNHIVSSDQGINFVYDVPENGLFGLVARSPILGLPDDISVQFIAVSDQSSTLAILSKSRYLYFDFGINKYRIEKWISELVARANAIAATKNAASNTSNTMSAQNTEGNLTNATSDQNIADHSTLENNPSAPPQPQ